MVFFGGCGDDPAPNEPAETVPSKPQSVHLESIPIERVKTPNEWRDARRLVAGQTKIVELGVLPPNAVFRAGFRGTNPDATLDAQLLIGDTPVLDLAAQGEVWNDGRIDLASFDAEGQSCRILYTADADFWIGPAELISPSTERANVLLFLLDTVRQDHLSCYGYERKTTPNMKAFLPEAVRFTHLVPQSSWTRPSIASFMTSTYPAEHGAIDNTNTIREGLPRLAESLTADGYECHGFVSNLNTLPQLGFAEGFARYLDLDSMNWFHTDPSHVVNAAIETIAHANGRPWFQFVHSIGAHHPYKPPQAYLNRFRTPTQKPLSHDEIQHVLDTCAQELTEIYALFGMFPGDADLRDPDNTVERVSPIIRQAAIDMYDGEIAYNDSQFQRLVQALKEHNAYDNTIIIVVSDHGEEFWEHGGIVHGYNLYEEQLRIPFLVKLPESNLGGTTINSIVEGVDLAPTILDIVGAPPEPRFRGRSLLPAMQGEPQAPRLGFASLNLRDLSIQAVKSAKMKTHIFPLESKSLWFDLQHDPFEQTPIDPPDIAPQFKVFATAAGAVGADGVHLYIKCELEKEEVFEGRIVCEELEDFEFRHSDGIGQSESTPDGMQFRVEMKPSAFYPFEHMSGRYPWQTIHLYLQVKDPGTIAIDLTVNGNPISLDAVESGAALAPVPLDGSPLSISALDAPSAAYDKGRFPDEFGVFLWYVPEAGETGSEALDPEMEEALRGMGYLD
jgi:arylsulfatase A-like enzyme